MGRKTNGGMSIIEKNGRPGEINKIGIIEQILVLTHPSLYNKKEKINLEEACTKLGITKQTFYNWLKANPELRNRWDEAIEIRKESIKLVARENVFDGITGDTKLRPKEKIELSKWVLEKTDSDFNPKQVIESKSMNLNFDVSIDEMENQLKNLFINQN